MKTHHVLKKSLAELTLRQCPLWSWVSVTEITDEFILGLNVLHAHNAFTDLGHHVL
jgi:hypothetical protein